MEDTEFILVLPKTHIKNFLKNGSHNTRYMAQDNLNLELPWYFYMNFLDY